MAPLFLHSGYFFIKLETTVLFIIINPPNGYL